MAMDGSVEWFRPFSVVVILEATPMYLVCSTHPEMKLTYSPTRHLDMFSLRVGSSESSGSTAKP